jgi:hypothetical protein
VRLLFAVDSSILFRIKECSVKSVVKC